MSPPLSVKPLEVKLLPDILQTCEGAEMQRCKDNTKSIIWMAAFFFNSRLPVSV